MVRPQDHPIGGGGGLYARKPGEQQPRNIANTSGLPHGNNKENALLHFRRELRQQLSNGNRQFGLLTDLAGRYIDFAADIAQIVEEAIRTAVPQHKIWLMQLLDAVCQKVRDDEDVYSRLFAEKILTLSVLVFNTAGGRVYSSMLALRKKWNGVFPADRLETLDFRLNELDRRWPRGVRASGSGQRPTNAQDRADPTQQHAQEADELPFVKAQRDLEAAKNRGNKRVIKVLREQYTDEKKARIDAQDRLSKTECELAVEKERHSATTRERDEVCKQKNALQRENSKLTARNTVLEHAYRDVKAGENAAEIKKKIRPEDTVYCGGNDPNEVVTEGKSVAQVVCGFRLCMERKPVFKGRCPKQQVLAYVDAYLEHERFPSEEKKKKVRRQLFAQGMLTVDERKSGAVKRMMKHL